jgi:hypothetical protein
VLSETATLTHEEHKPIEIPQGTWIVRIQREYEPHREWLHVATKISIFLAELVSDKV